MTIRWYCLLLGPVRSRLRVPTLPSMVWIPAQLPDRLCDDAGNRTTIDSVSKVADGVVVFWVPHFSTYEIVKVSAAADTAPAPLPRLPTTR